MAADAGERGDILAALRPQRDRARLQPEDQPVAPGQDQPRAELRARPAQVGQLQGVAPHQGRRLADEVIADESSAM